MDLRPNLFAPARRGRLYGTPPPRAGTPPGQVAPAAQGPRARRGGLPLDAVVVYDIQDETGRTGLPRPFPLIATLDPRDYAKFFSVPTIVYKALGDVDEAGWTAWLDASRGRDFLSIVGRPAPGKYALPLSRAIRVAAAHAAGYTIGGVVIAERHTAERSESARLLAKGIEGCAYFISQAGDHAPPSERLLADYLRDCRRARVAPRRIVLTFAPGGPEKTLAFLRWLGVNVAPETEREILGAARPLPQAIRLCPDNLGRIPDG